MEWDENKDGCLSVSRGSEFTLNYEIDLLVLASSFLECILWIKINYLMHIWPNNRLNPWNKRRYSCVNWGKIASAAIAKWSQSHDMEFFINWRHQWSSRIACGLSKPSNTADLNANPNVPWHVSVVFSSLVSRAQSCELMMFRDNFRSGEERVKSA